MITGAAQMDGRYFLFVSQLDGRDAAQTREPHPSVPTSVGFLSSSRVPEAS